MFCPTLRNSNRIKILDLTLAFARFYPDSHRILSRNSYEIKDLEARFRFFQNPDLGCVSRPSPRKAAPIEYE